MAKAKAKDWEVQCYRNGEWTDYEGITIKGDVNGNGYVDIGDAVTIVNYLVGKESSTFVAEAADTNDNGQIDIGDAVTIVNFLVGKTASLSRQANMIWDEISEDDSQ